VEGIQNNQRPKADEVRGNLMESCKSRPKGAQKIKPADNYKGKASEEREVARAEIVATLAMIAVAYFRNGEIELSVLTALGVLMLWLCFAFIYLLVEEDIKGIYREIRRRNRHYTSREI
jgi:uncharacterized membrane protein YciS (DUF1049 family)